MLMKIVGAANMFGAYKSNYCQAIVYQIAYFLSLVSYIYLHIYLHFIYTIERCRQWVTFSLVDIQVKHMLSIAYFFVINQR